MKSTLTFFALSMLFVSFISVSGFASGNNASRAERVVINSNNETIKLDAENKIVTVDGNNNTIYLIGVSKQLIIKGSGNVIELSSSESIVISGNKNNIFYSSDSQVITDTGDNNVSGSAQDVLKSTELAK